MLSKKIVKYIQSLSHKKLRDEEKVFVAEGPKVVAEFLSDKKFTCQILCASIDWLNANKNLIKDIALENIYEVDDTDLNKISNLKTPNKVIAVLNQINFNLLPEVSGKVSIMLDDIQDPGNLGTIIRLADWFGIDTIICSENCADCYNPKVVQSTMGSLGRVNIFYTSLTSFIKKHKKICVYGAALAGKSIYQIPPVAEGIILIGNESKGVSEELLNLVNEKITIPKYGKAESLNAAVATGIILSHFKAH